MAVRTKDELINFIDASEISDEIKIELMEDITDSFKEPEPINVEDDEKYKDLNGKYSELLDRYKKRFMEGPDNPEKEEKDEEKEDEKEFRKDDDIIDVRSI